MHPLTLDGGGRPVIADPPVVLAPMAGVTNVPFRALCRRYATTASASHDRGPLFVSEMVGARALVEAERQGLLEAGRDPHRARRRDGGWRGGDGPLSLERTVLRAAFGPEETTRSIQLYATEPSELRAGVAVLAERDLVDHIDLNFGCPAPKVTRLGGGAALPWRLDRFGALVAAAVGAADGRPVTVKMRKGIDPQHLTYLEAGRTARDVGAAAVTLHARTAYDAYGGHADWSAIGQLVDAIGGDVPVLGNGDIWQGADAMAMMAQTGCAGVVVGRGCLGRPWLFRDLDAALTGREVPPPPTLGEIAAMLIDHAVLLVEHLGEFAGMRDLRKHTNWYLQGFELGKLLRIALRQVEGLDQLRELLSGVDGDAVMPEIATTMHRGHTHGPKPVKLPQGWLDSRTIDVPMPVGAGNVVSGG